MYRKVHTINPWTGLLKLAHILKSVLYVYSHSCHTKQTVMLTHASLDVKGARCNSRCGAEADTSVCRSTCYYTNGRLRNKLINRIAACKEIEVAVYYVFTTHAKIILG